MKWDLTNYYKTYEEFRETLEKAKELVESLKGFEGKLKNEESLKEFYNKMIEFYGYEKLYLYAECQMDRDQRNTKALADMQEIMYLFNTFGELINVFLCITPYLTNSAFSRPGIIEKTLFCSP